MWGRNNKSIFIFISVLLVLAFTVISISDKVFLFSSPELHSPSNWIKEEQIKVYDDKVILDILNPSWAGFTNTNSMDPFIDETSNAIEIMPQDPNSVNVGDVISYQTKYGVVIHRVIDKNEDEDGIYYIVKGDNNSIRDPVKVRFNDLRGVVVAVIY